MTSHARSPNATLVLVQERLAEAAASFVVESDRQQTGQRRLFTEIDFSETPADGRAQMVAQIQLLHRRIFGIHIAADGEEVAANLALWEQVYAIEQQPHLAWTGLLSALLREPSLLFY